MKNKRNINSTEKKLPITTNDGIRWPILISINNFQYEIGSQKKKMRTQKTKHDDSKKFFISFLFEQTRKYCKLRNKFFQAKLI